MFKISFVEKYHVSFFVKLQFNWWVTKQWRKHIPHDSRILCYFTVLLLKHVKWAVIKNAAVLPDLVVFPRIPQKLRISGSLSVILVVFLLTAVLVKVKMEPLPFFAFTMIKIICINCEYHHHHHHHPQGVSSRPLDLSVVVFVVFSSLGLVWFVFGVHNE